MLPATYATKLTFCDSPFNCFYQRQEALMLFKLLKMGERSQTMQSSPTSHQILANITSRVSSEVWDGGFEVVRVF